MTKLAILMTLLLVTTISIASSVSFSRNSSSLGALASSWKATETTQLKPGHDINMVYGGADVSPRSAIIAPMTATA